jgi:D-3-phosphoglycerate dehydrogenase
MDVPGVVGQVGTLLGQHEINIAEWRMGRTKSQDPTLPSINLSFINLDSLAPPKVLGALTQLPRVFNVNQVDLA